MSELLQKAIREYLKYFQMFLDNQILDEELDYMLYVRDRLNEDGADLGALDSVWRANAKRMLAHNKVFNHPLSDAWWWKKEVWQKLASPRTKPKHPRRRVART